MQCGVIVLDVRCMYKVNLLNLYTSRCCTSEHAANLAENTYSMYVCMSSCNFYVPHTNTHTGSEALWEVLHVSGLGHVWYRQPVPANTRR